MHRLIVALVALSLSSPAWAGYPYLAIDAGSAQAKSNDVDETVVLSATPGPVSQPPKYDDVFKTRNKRGTDLGLLAGYDFGWFRLEGELAHKRVGMKRLVNDDITDQFLAELNSALNRPSAAPDPGAPGLPALTIADFQQLGTVKVGSAMVSAVLDLKVTNDLNLYAGGGFGRSFARGYGDSDGALANQRFAGARYALSNRVELGLKYRKFRSGIIKLDRDPVEFLGNPDLVAPGVTSTTNALVTPDIEGEFRTKSFLLTLVYNLR